MKGRRLLRRLIALAILALFLVWISPWLKNLVRIVRLYREPPPASLPVPVQGIGPGQLADTWGSARSEGRRHEGIDIFARRGTPVVAATHGVILRQGLNRLGGRVVGVLGPAGWYHYYAHLDQWSSLKTGDWVEPGWVLGYVGDSGNAKGTPTHLHYGIYVGGQARDPYPLLRTRAGTSPAPTKNEPLPLLPPEGGEAGRRGPG